MENRQCDIFFKSCCQDGSDEKVDSAKSRNGSTLNQNNASTQIEKEMMKEISDNVYHPNYNDSANRSQANASVSEYYSSPVQYEEQYRDTGAETYIERERNVQKNEENYITNYDAIYNQNYTSEYTPAAYNLKYIQDHVPESLPKHTPEYVPEYVPEYGSEYAPGYITEYPQNQYPSHEQSTQQYVQNYINNHNNNTTEKNEIIYRESREGEIPVINVKGDQPVFNVPVYQDKYLRDKYIEVPKYEVQDVIQPKMYSQETRHDVPTIELIYKEKELNIPKHKYMEKSVEVDIPIGYTPIYSPRWDIREVPRPVPKYEGEQKIIEVEVPQIKYVDKIVEKEIVVDIREKIIPKITEVEKPIDVVKYQWKEEYQDVPVYKYVPKIDVELDCPPPLIVPYPEAHFQNTAHIVNPNQTAADLSPEVLLKNMNMPKISNAHVNEAMKKSLLEIVRSASTQKSEKKEKTNWFFWKNNHNKKKKTETTNGIEEVDPETGYPKSMPKDFAHFFKKDLNNVKKQMNELNEKHSTSRLTSINDNMNNFDKSPVVPTVEYLGKIDKPPIDGGKLDAISFKLHAIEVHQFIPVPTLPKPKFLDLVPPERIEQNDISGLENVFGSIPEGWVDPNITGFIAPMMNDVLQGNIQPKSPLFSKISIGTTGNNTMPKMKTLSALPTEDHNALQKEMMQENFSCKNSMTYNKTCSAISQHHRTEEIYESPN